ncbi:hypothetical protein [Streptomyces bambusae]|uniref:hypothetical protein n=1 Tax=Streptomyces bambusae TaxID=1550616 RepID=UPI001CA5C9DF|nr:hypothetical protein [Streptomyces bambusae]
MRTALRTSIVTAALAGALLAPAASAFATPAAPSATTGATTSSASTSASTYGTLSAADRYAGEPVYIGEGLVAVLRNKEEGPEAWIRYVGPQWKPGDTYMVRVMEKLDRIHPAAVVNGLELHLDGDLDGEGTATPKLTVITKGKTSSYPLPKADSDTRLPQRCVSDVFSVDIQGGLTAVLSMTPDGPRVLLTDAASNEPYKKLNRTNPALPKGDRTVAFIDQPDTTEPSFAYRTSGNAEPSRYMGFPQLPKSCTFNYTPKAPRPESQPSSTPSATPSATPSGTPTPSAGTAGTDVKAQTAGQTVVVPQGGVAAGAELAADETSSTSVFAGLGLVAVVAALAAGWAHRARRGHSS